MHIMYMYVCLFVYVSAWVGKQEIKYLSDKGQLRSGETFKDRCFFTQNRNARVCGRLITTCTRQTKFMWSDARQQLQKLCLDSLVIIFPLSIINRLITIIPAPHNRATTSLWSSPQ